MLDDEREGMYQCLAGRHILYNHIKEQEILPDISEDEENRQNNPHKKYQKRRQHAEDDKNAWQCGNHTDEDNRHKYKHAHKSEKNDQIESDQKIQSKGSDVWIYFGKGFKKGLPDPDILVVHDFKKHYILNKDNDYESVKNLE